MFFAICIAIWVLLYGGTLLQRRRGRLREDLDRDLLGLGFLALLVVGFYWRPLLAGDIWMPADGGDLASFLYPTYRFAAESVRQGILPLWNPHLYGGMPFIGDIQSGLLYPVYLAAYLLTPTLTYRVLEGLAAFHVFAAGAAMYLMLRFMRPRGHQGGRIRRLACLAGATAFMFSDLFIVHFGNLNMIAAAAWLPLIFLLFHRALTDRRPGLAAWSGAALAVATLAGHIQITLFIASVLGFRAIWELAGGWIRRRGAGARLSWRSPLPLGYLAVAGLVAGGLSAPALLPFLQHTQFTERTAWSYSQTVQYSLAPGQFISLLVPTFFGRGPAFHWGVWDRVEVGYIGILALLLAGLSVFLRKDRETHFLLGLSIAGFLVAMGLYAMPHGWLYQLVPGFDQLRAPARFVLVLDFGLAGLAALGLDSLLRPMARGVRAALSRFWRFAAPAGIATALVLWGVVYLALLNNQDGDPAIFMRLSVAANGVGLFGLFIGGGLALIGARRYGRIRPAVLGLLAIGLIFLDLSSTGSYVDLGTKDPTARFDHPEIVAFLQSDDSLYRIDARTGIDQVWQPDTAIVHGLNDVWGIVNPLAMRDTIRYWEGMGSRSSRLYDALNVKYVIARKDVELDWTRFVPVFDGAPELNVYLNREALPRAWMVHDVITAASHEEAYDLIHSPDFEPATSVVLEAELQSAAPPGAGGDQVRIVSLRPNRIVVEVNAESAGVLALSEVHYPGWKARVNGRAAPVMRANYLFRAVEAPAGASEIVLTYSPLAWWLGLGMCGATLIGLGLWVFLPRGRRRVTREGAG